MDCITTFENMRTHFLTGEIHWMRFRILSTVENHGKFAVISPLAK